MKFRIKITLPSGEKEITDAEAHEPGDVAKAMHSALELVRKKYRTNVTVFDCDLKLMTVGDS